MGFSERINNTWSGLTTKKRQQLFCSVFQAGTILNQHFQGGDDFENRLATCILPEFQLWVNSSSFSPWSSPKIHFNEKKVSTQNIKHSPTIVHLFGKKV